MPVFATVPTNNISTSAVEYDPTSLQAFPLQIAARDGNLTELKKIIRAGGNPNAKNDDGKNALFYSVVHCHPKVAKVLFDCTVLKVEEERELTDVITRKCNELPQDKNWEEIREIFQGKGLYDHLWNRKDARNIGDRIINVLIVQLIFCKLVKARS